MAERAMVTRQAVSRWETGETTPNTETLKILSREFNVSTNTLLGSPRQLFCQCCGYHHGSRDEKAAGSILEEALMIYRLPGVGSVESRGGQPPCFGEGSILQQGTAIACEAGNP